jgi:hypothetical protein
MIGQSIPHLRFPSSKKWDCEFKERWEINQLKSWRGEENRENIEVGIYRMGNLSRDHCRCDPKMLRFHCLIHIPLWFIVSP